jgi:hypothetical protein
VFDRSVIVELTGYAKFAVAAVTVTDVSVASAPAVAVNVCVLTPEVTTSESPASIEPPVRPPVKSS